MLERAGLIERRRTAQLRPSRLRAVALKDAAEWFGGLECEIPLSTVSLDVRPGDAWRATMFCGPGRREIRWTGEYREVAAPERLAG